MGDDHKFTTLKVKKGTLRVLNLLRGLFGGDESMADIVDRMAEREARKHGATDAQIEAARNAGRGR